MNRGREGNGNILNAQKGSIVTTLTASQAMFDMVRAIAENVSGTNLVTSILEHPSAYDSMEYYAEKLGKEFRVAKSNPITGGVDVNEIIKLVDKDTCLLSVMYASNISGAIYDIESIVKKARAIKPANHHEDICWFNCISCARIIILYYFRIIRFARALVL